MLCPIKVNRNAIELAVDTSCYCVLDLLCVTFFHNLNTGVVKFSDSNCIFDCCKQSLLKTRTAQQDRQFNQAASMSTATKQNLKQRHFFLKSRKDFI